MYWHFNEKSNQVWVSAASASESESFATNALGYFLFLNASEILELTERDDLRIWSVNEYRSSRGKDFEISKILIAALNDIL